MTQYLTIFCCIQVYFGVSTLADAISDDGLKAEEEQKEVNSLFSLLTFFYISIDIQKLNTCFLQAELAVSELSGNGAGLAAAANTIISTFALLFVAEWGDKSFFSTIGQSLNF